jgi:protein-L-isoaspartate O-methyltransferase
LLAALNASSYNHSFMETCVASRDYVIRGGKEGKVRLDLLARVMLPTTVQLLDRVGMGRGMKCLDAGCGSGHVALLMGNLVGPEGRVIGTDTDPEILPLARKDAETAKVTNIEFLQVDACTSLWQQEFDVVYARFLFRI